MSNEEPNSNEVTKDKQLTQKEAKSTSARRLKTFSCYSIAGLTLGLGVYISYQNAQSTNSVQNSQRQYSVAGAYNNPILTGVITKRHNSIEVIKYIKDNNLDNTVEAKAYQALPNKYKEYVDLKSFNEVAKTSALIDYNSPLKDKDVIEKYINQEVTLVIFSYKLKKNSYNNSQVYISKGNGVLGVVNY